MKIGLSVSVSLMKGKTTGADATALATNRRPQDGRAFVLARHDHELVSRYRVHGCLVDIEMRHHQFGWRVGQPL
jgi:hypothetical protein